MSPERALQQAVKALLLASPAVTDVVGKLVYDEIPADRDKPKAPPWIYCGWINRRRFEGGCSRTWTLTMRLYAATVTFGRGDTRDLLHAISEALEGQDPALETPFAIVQELRCIQAGDVVEPATPKTVFVDVTAVIQQKGD